MIIIKENRDANAEAEATKITNDFLDYAKSSFKRLGLKSRSSKQSASFELEFMDSKQVVVVYGWHGDKKWGGSSLIHGIMAGPSNRPQNLPIFVMPGVSPNDYAPGIPKSGNLTAADLVAYKKNIAEGKKWIDNFVKTY